jgi:deoxyribose-phosphate aldolase
MENLDLLISCIDLTSLRGDETRDEIRALCWRAADPAPGRSHVAAVVVYPTMISLAAAELAGTGVRVATVTGGFPVGVSSVSERIAQIESALADGSDEIDTVLDRAAIAAQEEARAFEEIAASKAACGAAKLKVILETGELGTEERIRQAAGLAMSAGADFLKTSTGKVPVGATLQAAQVVLESIRGFYRKTGRPVGFKAAGGIRTVEQALAFAELTGEVLEGPWLTPDRFRIGASELPAGITS